MYKYIFVYIFLFAKTFLKVISILLLFQLIFTDVKNKQLFLTYNEAEQMIQIPINFVPSRVLMHPTQEDWVLGYDLKAGKVGVYRHGKMNFNSVYIYIYI